MDVFVTGATGFIGVRLVRRLAVNGCRVHALYRSESKTAPIKMEGVDLFRADLLEYGSLLKAVAGCEQGYHLAAFAGIWERDRTKVYRYNVEDVVSGMILAMERGRSGERYILGGENLSYRELFHLVRSAAEVNRKHYSVPFGIAMAAAGIMLLGARTTGRAPLIVPGLVRKYYRDWRVSSKKAEMELGYDPMPV